MNYNFDGVSRLREQVEPENSSAELEIIQNQLASKPPQGGVVGYHPPPPKESNQEELVRGKISNAHQLHDIIEHSKNAETI